MFKKLSVLSISISLISGCMTVGPDFKQPKIKVARDWQYASKRTNASVKLAQTKSANWWKLFKDPTLNALVLKGYQDNLSLQTAGVRVLYSRANLAKSVGSLYPQKQSISGSYDYNRLGGSSLGGLIPNKFYSGSLGLAANWELDFWGKYRRAIEGNNADFLSSMAGYDYALVSMIGDIATTYFNIRMYESLIHVTRKNINTQRHSLQIVESRFRSGQTSKLDVEQAKTQLGQTRAQLPSQISNLKVQKNQLAVLLGTVPGDVDNLLRKSRGLPFAPRQIEVGFPKEVLAQRPDVAQARLDAMASSAAIGATKAELFPALSLVGSFSFSSTSIGQSSVSDLFDWSRRQVTAGPSVAFPIFNYGQITNAVRMQDALFQQSLLNYQNTVLQAQQEVQNSIVQYLQAKNGYYILAQTVRSARESTRLALVKYQSGETSYTSVLDAQKEQLGIESSLVETKASIDIALASLFRALGGGWQLRGDSDVISDEIREQMAARTNWGGLLKPANHLPQLVSKQSAIKKIRPIW